MNIQEPGVLPASLRYFFTPSSFAEQVLFYLTRVGSYVCDRNYYFSGQSEIGLNPTHHQHFMLILIGAGSLQLNINEHAYTAQSGDIIFVDCKMPHEYHAGPSGVTFDWIVFDGIGMQELFSRITELHGNRQVFPAAAYKEIRSITERFIACAQGTLRMSETSRSKLLYSILCSMFLNQKKANSPSAELVEHAMNFMDLHFTETMHVEDVAEEVGLSASHLTRCFRLQIGYSPYEYLMLRRIDRTKELLLSTNMSVHRIAFECGYHSDENFIRSFRKSVGVSPKQFRNFPI